MYLTLLSLPATVAKEGELLSISPCLPSGLQRWQLTIADRTFKATWKRSNRFQCPVNIFFLYSRTLLLQCQEAEQGVWRTTKVKNTPLLSLRSFFNFSAQFHGPKPSKHLDRAKLQKTLDDCRVQFLVQNQCAHKHPNNHIILPLIWWGGVGQVA